MFNQELFQHETETRMLPQSSMQFDCGHATLYVFTPYQLPDQFLRPYHYQFNPNLVDYLAENKGRMRNAPAMADPNVASMINTAILPSANGIYLDTVPMSQQWSFVLIIDSGFTPGSENIQVSGPKNRVICAGYCIDEPVDVKTGNYNPNAVLNFTKTNSTYVKNMIGPIGVTTEFQNRADVDYVNETAGQLTQTDLMIGTPNVLINSTQYDPTDNTYMFDGSNSVSNIKNSVCSEALDSTLKTPSYQFKRIAQELDAAIATGNDSSNGINFVNPMNVHVADDPSDIAKQQFYRSAPGRPIRLPSRALDTSVPITLYHLYQIYPNLTICPLQIPPCSGWEVSPQGTQTLRNAMCSMIASSLANLLPSSGLADIAFRYNSFMVQNGLMGDNDGVMVILSARPIIQMPEERMRGSLDQFERYFKTMLAPIIRTCGGEFDVMASIDMVGHTLVDLHFKDENDTLGSGFYETVGRLGGLMNPMLADFDTFQNNASELSTLADQTVFKCNPGVKALINSCNWDQQFTGDPSMAGAAIPPSPINPVQPAQYVPSNNL